MFFQLAFRYMWPVKLAVPDIAAIVAAVRSKTPFQCSGTRGIVGVAVTGATMIEAVVTVASCEGPAVMGVIRATGGTALVEDDATGVVAVESAGTIMGSADAFSGAVGQEDAMIVADVVVGAGGSML